MCVCVCVKTRNSARAPVPTTARTQPQTGGGVDSVDAGEQAESARMAMQQAYSPSEITQILKTDISTLYNMTPTNAHRYSWRGTAVARESIPARRAANASDHARAQLLECQSAN